MTCGAGWSGARGGSLCGSGDEQWLQKAAVARNGGAGGRGGWMPGEVEVEVEVECRVQRQWEGSELRE